MITLEDIRGRATISVREAVEVTGFGRDQVYAAIRRGQFPALRLGRSIRVPVPQLLTWLGYPSDSSEGETATASPTAPNALATLAKGTESRHDDTTPAA